MKRFLFVASNIIGAASVIGAFGSVIILCGSVGGKLVIVTGNFLERHERNIDKIAVLAGGSFITFITAEYAASIIGQKTRPRLPQPKPPKIVPVKRCYICKYYNPDNNFLHCAVHPDLPDNCPDYEWELK